MYQNIVEWLPLLVAITAGSFALSQIRSNNITNARIKWLENLKQLLTDFLSESFALQLKVGLNNIIVKRIKSENPTQTVNNIYDEFNLKIVDQLKIMESKCGLIKLNLNPKEPLNLRFEEFLFNYLRLIEDLPKTKESVEFDQLLRKMGALEDTLVLFIRIILKLEWEKTKRSGISHQFYIRFGKGKELLNEGLTLELQPERK